MGISSVANNLPLGLKATESKSENYLKDKYYCEEITVKTATSVTKPNKITETTKTDKLTI